MGYVDLLGNKYFTCIIFFNCFIFIHFQEKNIFLSFMILKSIFFTHPRVCLHL